MLVTTTSGELSFWKALCDEHPSHSSFRASVIACGVPWMQTRWQRSFASGAESSPSRVACMNDSHAS
eukprot:5973317-Prymnesium_polylepis.2